MNKVEKIERKFFVGLAGKVGERTARARHWVFAVDVRDARTKALEAHQQGKVRWHEKKKVSEVEVTGKPSIELMDTVIHHYLKGTDPALLQPVFNKGKTTSERGTYFGFPLSRGGPMADRGTEKYSYGASGLLYSYDMEIAYRTTYGGKVFVLVNGDGAPTKATNDFMRKLQDRLNDREWDTKKREWKNVDVTPHAYIPFSVLRQAGFTAKNVRVIATTPDRVVRVKRKSRSANSPTGEVYVDQHFLGETLFEADNRVFVCGLDRNDDPRKRMFYMCQIPVGTNKKKWPKTVDEALEMLRPEGLPKTARRQGEWFFVPEKKYKPSEKAQKGLRIPIVSARPEEQVTTISYVPRDRQRRHVASTLVVDGAVYARGQVTDAEHSTLKLGPVWHRVVLNKAVMGWRYVPTGQERGPRVD